MYFDTYIHNHRSDGVKSVEDVFSLMLSHAILMEDVGMVVKILRHNRSNLLTTVHQLDCSPLSTALRFGSDEIITLIGDYIQQRALSWVKVISLEKDLLNLKSALLDKYYDPPAGFTDVEYILHLFKGYLQPIYVNLDSIIEFLACLDISMV